MSAFRATATESGAGALGTGVSSCAEANPKTTQSPAHTTVDKNLARIILSRDANSLKIMLRLDIPKSLEG
jgi:hypothetical protein